MNATNSTTGDDRDSRGIATPHDHERPERQLDPRHDDGDRSEARRARRLRRPAHAEAANLLAPATRNTAPSNTAGDDVDRGHVAQSSSTTSPSRATSTSSPGQPPDLGRTLADHRRPHRRCGWGRDGTARAAWPCTCWRTTPRSRRCSGPSCTSGRTRRWCTASRGSRRSAPCGELECTVAGAEATVVGLLVIAEVRDAEAVPLDAVAERGARRGAPTATSPARRRS